MKTVKISGEPTERYHLLLNSAKGPMKMYPLIELSSMDLVTKILWKTSMKTTTVLKNCARNTDTVLHWI